MKGRRRGTQKKGTHPNHNRPKEGRSKESDKRTGRAHRADSIHSTCLKWLPNGCEGLGWIPAGLPTLRWRGRGCGLKAGTSPTSPTNVALLEGGEGNGALGYGVGNGR